MIAPDIACGVNPAALVKVTLNPFRGSRVRSLLKETLSRAEQALTER